MDIDSAMQTALRVLAAILEQTEPNGADVVELRRIAPIDANLPVDELACQVVNAAVEERKKGARHACR